MAYYLIINGLISAAILVLVRLYPATVNYRYRLVCFSIALWLIPWHLLGILIPTTYETNMLWLIADFQLPQQSASGTAPQLNLLSYWSFLVYFVFTLGLAILVKRIIEHNRWYHQLKTNYIKQKGLTNNTEIYFSENISSAIIIGILSPKIWISSTLKKSPYLDTIIAHEKQHIIAKDNLKLFLLMVVESLFWWNPLVRLLVSELRFLIEARCDEAMCAQLGEQQYLSAISSLIIEQQPLTTSEFVSSAVSSSKHNLKRVKQIKDKPTMNLKKHMSYIFTVLVSIFSITAIALSSEQKSLAINTDQETMQLLSSKAVSVNFEQISLEALAKLLADTAGLDEVILEDKIKQQKVNINVENIPLTQVFSMISSQHNVDVAVDNKKLVISENTGGFKTGTMIKSTSDKNQLGALLSFSIEIKNTDNKKGTSAQTADFTVWADFDKQAFIKLSDRLQMALEVTDQGESAYIQMKLMQSTDTAVISVIAEPAIMTLFDKKASIEIVDESKGEFVSVSVNAQKSKKPS